MSDLGDMVHGLAAGATAAAAEALKLTAREREANERKRKSAIVREVARLSLVLLKAEGELEREDYDEAQGRCEAETKTWGQPGEPEDWVDCEEIVALRVQIMDIRDNLTEEEEEEDEDLED